jgi:hypothetical protein
MILTAPQRFRLGDEATEVTVGAGVSGGPGLREQPLGRDTAFRFLHAFSDQVSDGVVVV